LTASRSHSCCCAPWLWAPRADCSSFTKATCRKSARSKLTPNVVTEIYADDGQLVGSFALQPPNPDDLGAGPQILYNAVTAIEDQHFEDHWGVDFPRVAGAALTATS